MEDLAFLENASASFDDLAMGGHPSPPLQFERPGTGRAERVDAPVLNPITQEVLEVSNIIYERHADGRPPERAYWVGRKLKKCIFGVVKECTLLRFRNNVNVPWEVTPDKAAVKIMSWKKIRELEHIEDPIKEVAAMQYVSKDGTHPHVMGLLDVLQDEEYLLMFMPFCSSGDLFSFVQQAGKFPEPMARYWFRQILEVIKRCSLYRRHSVYCFESTYTIHLRRLQGLSHLQKMGVCHRDMSLENILVDEYKTSVVIDLGMCLKVPYDDGETGGVADVSAGTLRRLVTPLIPCGKPNYISPEVLKSQEPFDGFAIDLWASAVILFIMLVGLPPWEFAREEDPRYRMVVRGGLERMLRSWQRPVSPLAADLLQKMLREDPRERLSLCEIKDHPWVVYDEGSAPSESLPPAPVDEAWRK
jgi:serine/threonine protein kinase